MDLGKREARVGTNSEDFPANTNVKKRESAKKEQAMLTGIDFDRESSILMDEWMFK